MERFGGSLVAFYPEAIQGVSLNAPVRAIPMHEITVTVHVLGTNGPVPGAAPVEITLTDPTGRPSPLSGVRATDSGMIAFRWMPGINDAPGPWSVKATDLAGGRSADASILLGR